MSTVIAAKENQVNVVAASSSTAVTTTKPTTSIIKRSPYAQRMHELEEARMAAGDTTHSLLHVSDEDALLESVLGEDDEDVNELGSAEREAAMQRLSQSAVDKGLLAMVVPRSLCEQAETIREDLVYADPRNDRGSGMVMLNTYSSFCMYPVIGKALTAATKRVNAALKQQNASTETANLAQQAFEQALATILAIHRVDHWRHDTESEEDVVKIAKRVLKLGKDLLSFTNAEWGIHDPFTRPAVLHFLQSLAREWTDSATYCEGMPSMNFRTAKNGQGRGRPLPSAAAAAANPVAKKAKTVQVASVAAVATSTNNKNLLPLTTHFSAIHDKLSQRIKTLVQLAITDLQQPKKVEHVIVSGATDMKKMHHLLAYLTGSSPDFEYHSQKGKSTKGCYFEVTAGPNHKPCWLAEKAAAKKAAAVGADCVVDKSVKIVQVFQGLNCSANGGMVYAADDSLNKTSLLQLVFVSPTKGRFAVQATAVVPTKAIRGKMCPLPRVVTYRSGANKSGLLGLPMLQTKRVLQGDRQNPSVIVFGGNSWTARNFLNMWATPICDAQGGRVGAFCYDNDAAASIFFGGGWDRAAVLSAGPPDGASC